MKDQRKMKAQLIKELETLRQSEERYRQLFESANDAIMSLTLDGIITAVNRGAEVLLGWSREEQVGRHYREFLTPPSVTFTEERARRIIAPSPAMRERVGVRVFTRYAAHGRQKRQHGQVLP